MLIGSVVDGTYEITRAVAEGGMGAVFEAKHLRLGRRVALKVLLGRHTNDRVTLARFRREAEIIAQLGHPHIVQAFDVGALGTGEPYMVMEYLEGETLAERLDRVRHVSVAETVRIVSQIASALAASHAQDVVHRDMKPENVFLVRVAGEPDFVKVLDFGISKLAHGAARITDERATLGTPAYMAPEQVRGARTMDHRVDQFSLAVMVYEMISGVRPFHGEDVVAILYQVVHEVPRPLSEVAPWASASIDAAVARAMAKDPDQRYPSVSQFAWALENAARAVGARPTSRIPRQLARSPGEYHGGGREERSRSRNTPPPERPGAHGESARKRIEAALEAARADDLDAAVEHAEAVLELAVFGHDPEVYRLLGPAMPELERIFARRVGPMARRVAARPAADARKLSPHAAQLVTLADGGQTVAELISSSGIPKRDAVRMLAGLIIRRGLLVDAP